MGCAHDNEYLGTRGAAIPEGYQALQPYFDEMFLGRGDVAATLRDAQAAANAAAER